jgi:hypothetical protein
METIDHNDTDDMGSICFRTSAASLGRCSSLPPRDIFVDDCESQPRDARAPITSILIGMGIWAPSIGTGHYSQQLDIESDLSDWDPNLDHSKAESTKLGCKRLQPPFKPFNGTRIPTPTQTSTGFPVTTRCNPRPAPRSIGTQHSSRNDDSIARDKPAEYISQDQLVAEVKGIYAGLVMVETKCIEVDNTDTAKNNSKIDSKLNNEQWQALIALHRTLLHEHHDFFLASQHPSASPALRRLATKYAMPVRMWRHGIHSFLELLRHSPKSLEHMLTFLYLAYSMLALLYETVPAFEDTWIECLGDLGRHRMAIEDDDIRDREVWTGVSRHWYSKATEGHSTGRLYHHLAILARPNALQQLYYYTKSLCVPIPSSRARESIMTLFGAPDKSPATGGPYRRGKPPRRSIKSMASSDAQAELLIHPALEPAEFSMLSWAKASIADNHHGTGRHLKDLRMSRRGNLIDLSYKLLSSREISGGSSKRKRLIFYWVCCAACFTTYVLGLIDSCISWLSLSLFGEHAEKTPRAHRRSWVDFDGDGSQKPALVDINPCTTCPIDLVSDPDSEGFITSGEGEYFFLAQPFLLGLLSFLCRSLQDFVLYVCLTPFYLFFFLLDTSLGILREGMSSIILEGRFYEHTPGGLRVACLRRPFMDLTVGIPRCMAAQSVVLAPCRSTNEDCIVGKVRRRAI